MKAHKIILFFILFFGALPLGAQEDTLFTETIDSNYLEDIVLEQEYPAYIPPPAAKSRPVEETVWKKASGTLDYSADRAEPEPEKEQKELPNLEGWNFESAWWAKVLQGLAVILALAGIAYGIYRMLQGPKNSKVRRNDVSIESENLEEFLMESDLDTWLREALTAGNYTLAVRIHFLQLIKMLAIGGHIVLSMEKTNRDYLRELRGHRNIDAFRNLTRRYEEVWYGNNPVGTAAYARLAADFKAVS